MLVVIVVAAATAFSFFVASYQKQVQAQETLQHDKNLENLRILSLEPIVDSSTGDLTSLTVELASLDPNEMIIQGLDLDGVPDQTYSVVDSAGGQLGTGCLNGNPYSPTSSTCNLTIPAESQVFLQFDLTSSDCSFLACAPALTESSLIEITTYTSLGNEFSQSFVPPVAIAEVTFVDSYPVLDGSGSYQPSESNESVTINQWEWSVTSATPDEDCGHQAGEEVELHYPFTSGTTYTIYLNVTSSDSLEGSVSIVYEFD